MFKLGLIINPFAGVGGSVALKGSDGEAIRKQALAMGAKKLAQAKSKIALECLRSQSSKFTIYTVSGEMGSDLCQALNYPYQIVTTCSHPSTAHDTQLAIKALIQAKVDLILFAGGDGTARNILEVCPEHQAVLGIPAGVKIHSGVYAVSPEAAGLLVKQLIEGKLLSLVDGDIMDIDENAFRQGVVKASRYGEMKVPASLEYVQNVKSGGREVEELVLEDIAADIIENMQEGIFYAIGSGTSCAAIMEQLDLDNTLLGIDLIHNRRLHQRDVNESDLLALLNSGAKLKFVLTVIGGQGHILGRGNQQISPEVVRLVGWDNFEIIATKTKLQSLNGRPLLTDTGDVTLDESLKGMKSVTTGYHDLVIYPVGYSSQQ